MFSSDRLVRGGDHSCDLCGVHESFGLGVWKKKLPNFDLCPFCAETEKGRAYMEENGGNFLDEDLTFFIDAGYTDFGSFLEWIPLVWDNDTRCGLLYNMVPTSKNYQRVALSSVDDHGREGYFIIPGSLTDVIERLREKVVIYESQKKMGDPNWDDHYGCPINLLLTEEDKPAQFG